MSIATAYGEIIGSMLWTPAFTVAERGTLKSIKAKELKYPVDFTVLIVHCDKVTYLDYYFGLHGKLWNSEGSLITPVQLLKAAKDLAGLYGDPDDANWTIKVPKPKFFVELIKKL